MLKPIWTMYGKKQQSWSQKRTKRPTRFANVQCPKDVPLQCAKWNNIFNNKYDTSLVQSFRP